jgi:hypothetical protein
MRILVLGRYSPTIHNLALSVASTQRSRMRRELNHYFQSAQMCRDGSSMTGLGYGFKVAREMEVNLCVYRRERRRREGDQNMKCHLYLVAEDIRLFQLDFYQLFPDFCHYQSTYRPLFSSFCLVKTLPTGPFIMGLPSYIPSRDSKAAVFQRKLDEINKS